MLELTVRMPTHSDKKEESYATVFEDGTFSSQTGGASTSNSKQARPKRVRTKAEKKEAAPESVPRFHCNYCGRDLSTQIRARCAECSDYDSCLDCFSVGASLKPHQPSHTYRLIEVVHAPVYQMGWSADEEDKLLEGLEMYGVGNWEQVARSIATKNDIETEQHFLKVYLSSAGAPLPDPARLLPVDRGAGSDANEPDPKLLRVMHKHQQEEAAGWMPKREDFVYEWDNEAEDILGDMEIGEDDSMHDREMKMQVLEIYNSKLDERLRRKKFVVSRGLTDFKAHQAAEKRRPREEREVREKLQVFARLLSTAEMDRCVAGILEERHLRAQLDTYREARARGATTPAECGHIMAGRSASKLRDSGMFAANASRHRGDDSALPNSDADLRSFFLGRDVDVSEQPGAELLSRTELALCTALKITVHQYMIVKEVLVRESARLGCVRKKDAKAMVRLDQAKVAKIYDYLLACGWIRSPSA